MDVTFTLSENEYVKANRLYGKPTRGIKLFYLITFIALVVTFILSETLKIKVIVSVGFICGVIGHCLVAYVYAPWQTRKQYKSYKAIQDPICLSLQPNGLHFKSNTGESNLDWSRVVKWRESSDFILIYQAPCVYHIIPKRIGDLAINIRGLLKQSVGVAI
jgi:hypothetical protein